MKTNDLRKTKAITLIALVVTIVVLLILAGVSIAVLTGENGILNRASQAKTTNEEKQAEEELRLGISALTIDYRKNTTNTDSFRDYVMNNKQALANAMGVNQNELTMDAENYSVTYKEQTYTITDDGKLEPFVLVPLTAFNIVEETLEVSEGETKKLTIQKTPSNANERIEWTSSDDTIATVDENGNVTGVKNGTQTATISAISKSRGVASNTSCVVTVKKALGYFKTENGIAYYYASPTATTGTAITEDNMGHYLGNRVLYIPSGNITSKDKKDNVVNIGTSTIYRIFYVDVDGKYGDGNGTIYLKADQDSQTGILSALPESNGNTKINDFNRLWYENDIYKNSTYENVSLVKKLLDPDIWSAYKDDESIGIAKYVVGAPPVEMWIDSYNIFLAVTGKESEYKPFFNCTVTRDTNTVIEGTSNKKGPVGDNYGYGYYVGHNGNYYADRRSDGWSTEWGRILTTGNFTSDSEYYDKCSAWSRLWYSQFANAWLLDVFTLCW